MKTDNYYSAGLTQMMPEDAHKKIKKVIVYHGGGRKILGFGFFDKK